jgi:RNA polymerase sigma-70 factor (sigma-E family)
MRSSTRRPVEPPPRAAAGTDALPGDMTDDTESLAAFVAARGEALSRTAYLLTGSHAAAEDLVQSSLAKLLPRWGRIRRRGGDPERYVRRVMVNEHVSGWRRTGRGREVATPAPALERAGGDESDAAAWRLTLRSALREIAPRQRAVLVLRFYEDLSVAETAQLLGCSTGTVKSQTSDALDRLRKLAPGLTGTDLDEEAPR